MLNFEGSIRDVIPAIQVMINCGDAGTCNGGDSNAANAWVYKNGGIPDVTCQQYQAKNMAVRFFLGRIIRSYMCIHTCMRRKHFCILSNPICVSV